MTWAWTEDLKKAQQGDMQASDRLIIYFMPVAKRFANMYGGRQDPTELEGELLLVLVQTIRERVQSMVDNRLDRLVSAHLFYCCSRVFRRGKYRVNTQIKQNDIVHDLTSSQFFVDEVLGALDPEEERLSVLLMEGHTIASASREMNLSRTKVYKVLKSTQEKVQELMSN